MLFSSIWFASFLIYLGVLLVYVGLITLLVIIYQSHSASLVHARSREELEDVLHVLCGTPVWPVPPVVQSQWPIWPVNLTGLTGETWQFTFSGMKSLSWSSHLFTCPPSLYATSRPFQVAKSYSNATLPRPRPFIKGSINIDLQPSSTLWYYYNISNAQGQADCPVQWSFLLTQLLFLYSSLLIFVCIFVKKH
jgi:hypothetical protein